MIYLYLFGTCFHFIYVFMIIAHKIESTTGFTTEYTESRREHRLSQRNSFSLKYCNKRLKTCGTLCYSVVNQTQNLII